MLFKHCIGFLSHLSLDSVLFNLRFPEIRHLFSLLDNFLLLFVDHGLILIHVGQFLVDLALLGQLLDLSLFLYLFVELRPRSLIISPLLLNFDEDSLLCLLWAVAGSISHLGLLKVLLLACSILINLVSNVVVEASLLCPFNLCLVGNNSLILLNFLEM